MIALLVEYWLQKNKIPIIINCGRLKQSEQPEYQLLVIVPCLEQIVPSEKWIFKECLVENDFGENDFRKICTKQL